MLLLYNKAYAIFTKRLFSDLKDFHKLIYGMFSVEHFSENKKRLFINCCIMQLRLPKSLEDDLIAFETVRAPKIPLLLKVHFSKNESPLLSPHHPYVCHFPLTIIPKGLQFLQKYGIEFGLQYQKFMSKIWSLD